MFCNLPQHIYEIKQRPVAVETERFVLPDYTWYSQQIMTKPIDKENGVASD